MAENVETEAPDLVAVQVERPTLVVKRNDRGFDRSRPQIILYNHRPGPRFSSTEFVRREDKTFRELSEAMLAKGMLNSAGIECFLVDDNTGRMLGFISNVIGGMDEGE